MGTWLIIKMKIINSSSVLTSWGCRVSAKVSSWPVPSICLGWKPVRYSSMYGRFCANRLGREHTSPVQTVASVLQLKGSLWSWIWGYWFHQGEPSTLAVDQSRKLSTQQCYVIVTLTACVAKESSLPRCDRWPLTLQECSFTLQQVPFLILLGI